MKKSVNARRKMIQIKNNKNKNKTNNKQLVTTKNIPIVKSKKISMPSPKVTYGKDGDMNLSHVELITTVTTGSSNSSVNGFNLIGFHVNAGLKSTFPYLNAFAQNFTSYDFIELKFIYVPRGNVTRDGAIMMYAEYDPGSEAPENRIEFLNRKNAVESQVFEQLAFTCDGSDLKKEKSHYVRIGKIPTNSDIKLYDCAILYFAYEGTPKTTLIGDIFVQYKVHLSTPKLRLAEKQIANVESVYTRSVNGSSTTTSPLGTLGSIAGDFLGTLLNTATGGLSGSLFSTGKSILKLVSLFLPSSTGSSLPADVGIRVYQYKPNLIEKDGIGLITLNEDDADLLSKFENDQSEFVDLTDTNVVLLTDGQQGFTRVKTLCLAVPANGIIQFRYLTSPTTNPVGGEPVMQMTDYDGVKTGLLNKNDVVGIPYYNDN